jgi:hypothetical protein
MAWFTSSELFTISLLLFSNPKIFTDEKQITHANVGGAAMLSPLFYNGHSGNAYRY